MNRQLLNLNEEIPYYTNSNIHLFAWYAFYKNNNLIKEYNRFTNIRFDDIPKDGIKDFGLYGLGIRLNTDLEFGNLSIDCNNTTIFNLTYNISNSSILTSKNNQFHIFNAIPFELKRYTCDYDSIIRSSNTTKPKTDQYMVGYTGTVLLDKTYPINIRNYYVIDITNTETTERPYRAVALSEVYPVDGIKYINKDYFLSMEIDTPKTTNHVSKTINFIKNEKYSYKIYIL